MICIKIIEWNIKHGGSVERIPKILDSILKHDADVVVISEFRSSRQDHLVNGLAAGGYSNYISSDPGPGKNGIFIASKVKLRHIPTSYIHEEAKQRWLEIEIEELNCRLLCLHVPGAGDAWGKEPFWRAVLEYAKDNLEGRSMMIGDFNTGLGLDTQGTPFVLSECMESLLDMGWVDVWRTMNPGVRDYTWYSSAGNGFRLDYLFASPSILNEVREVGHSHEEREKGFSDHSLLFATIIEQDIHQ